MRATILSLGLLLLLAGCTSTENGENAPVILPYFENEGVSLLDGQLERHAAPQPDAYGYANHYFAVSGIACPDGSPPEIVSFGWNNPATGSEYLAGAADGPVSHYRAVHEAAFNISVRVDYVCEGRPQVAEAKAERKEFMLYFGEEGVLYSQEARITCPGGYMPAEVSEKNAIEKGIPVGLDSGEGWVVSGYRMEAAEPYDYSLYGCGKYDEHWFHTYLRESKGGASCQVGDCRGSWHTFECPEDNEEGVRIEVYAGKGCASVSQQKDFRHPSRWYDLLGGKEYSPKPA